MTAPTRPGAQPRFRGSSAAADLREAIGALKGA